MNINKSIKKSKDPAAKIATAKSAAPITTGSPTVSTGSGSVATAKPRIGHISFELVKPEAKQVCVAGDFNGWKPEKAPLIRKGDRWVGDLQVTPGRHEYLFVVDGQWITDPNAKETVQNPYGGRNCILTVSA